MRLFIAFLLTLTLASSAWAQVGVLRNTTITTNGQTVTLKLDPIESLGVSVDNSGTYGLAFEASMDNGVTYFAVGLVDSSDYTVDTTTSGAGKWWFANLGMTHFRVRATSYSSGTPVVKFVRGYGGITAPLSAGSVSGANAAAGATGSAVPASASYTGLNIGGTHRGWTGFSVGSQYAGAMAIVDGSGNQITSFGGGTQYTEADTDASITGTALMFESNTGTNTLSVVNNSTPLPVGDAGGSLTVDNAGTFAVQAAQSGTWNVTNISGTVSLPTGAATSANQSTEITALQLIDNPVGSSTGGSAGTSSFMAGGIYNSSAPTLTNGQQAALQLSSSGALIVTGAAGTTQYAEDAAHASGDQTVVTGTVRRDTTPSTSAGSAGDYAVLNTDGNGRLYTQAVLYNSSGTELSLASDKAEDAAHVDGDPGPVVLTRRVDTASTSSGTSGDYSTLNTDSLGRLWTRRGDPCADYARVQVAVIDTSTSGNVEVVALNGSDLIYVCGYSVVVGATGTSVQFVYGTGSACATGETNLTGAWPFAANGGITQSNAGVPQFVVPAGNALCVELSAANPIAGHVTYVRTATP